MSFSLALQNGDLVPQGGNLGIVWGVEKLVQDLTLWLTEGLGGDIMHPELGSILDAWIGRIIDSSTKSEINTEVLRVLNNYQRVQVRGIKSTPQRYSLSEILWDINSIDISLDYDAVSVIISVSTAPPESRIAQIIVTAAANQGE